MSSRTDHDAIEKTATSYSPHHPDDIFERFGRCYELAAQEVAFGSLRGCTLVHGSIEGGGNPRIGHAWVIRPDGTRYDPVMDMEFTAEVHQSFFDAIVDQKYSEAETREMLLKTGNYGPWGRSSGKTAEVRIKVSPLDSNNEYRIDKVTLADDFTYYFDDAEEELRKAAATIYKLVKDTIARMPYNIAKVCANARVRIESTGEGGMYEGQSERTSQSDKDAIITICIPLDDIPDRINEREFKFTLAHEMFHYFVSATSFWWEDAVGKEVWQETLNRINNPAWSDRRDEVLKIFTDRHRMQSINNTMEQSLADAYVEGFADALARLVTGDRSAWEKEQGSYAENWMENILFEKVGQAVAIEEFLSDGSLGGYAAAMSEGIMRDKWGDGYDAWYDSYGKTKSVDFTTPAWLALAGSVPVGVCTVFKSTDAWTIKDVHVLSQHRGKGVARNLVEAVKRSAAGQGVKRICLHNVQNGVEGFWGTMGFEDGVLKVGKTAQSVGIEWVERPTSLSEDDKMRIKGLGAYFDIPKPRESVEKILEKYPHWRELDLMGWEVKSMFVARIDGVIVGACTYQSDPRRNVARVHNIAVDTACRHRGVGRSLVDAAKERAKGEGFGGVIVDGNQNKPFWSSLGATYDRSDREWLMKVGKTAEHERTPFTSFCFLWKSDANIATWKLKKYLSGNRDEASDGIATFVEKVNDSPMASYPLYRGDSADSIPTVGDTVEFGLPAPFTTVRHWAEKWADSKRRVGSHAVVYVAGGGLHAWAIDRDTGGHLHEEDEHLFVGSVVVTSVSEGEFEGRKIAVVGVKEAGHSRLGFLDHDPFEDWNESVEWYGLEFCDAVAGFKEQPHNPFSMPVLKEWYRSHGFINNMTLYRCLHLPSELKVGDVYKCSDLDSFSDEEERAEMSNTGSGGVLTKLVAQEGKAFGLPIDDMVASGMPEHEWLVGGELAVVGVSKSGKYHVCEVEQTNPRTSRLGAKEEAVTIRLNMERGEFEKGMADVLKDAPLLEEDREAMLRNVRTLDRARLVFFDRLPFQIAELARRTDIQCSVSPFRHGGYPINGGTISNSFAAAIQMGFGIEEAPFDEVLSTLSHEMMHVCFARWVYDAERWDNIIQPLLEKTDLYNKAFPKMLKGIEKRWGEEYLSKYDIREEQLADALANLVTGKTSLIEKMFGDISYNWAENELFERAASKEAVFADYEYHFDVWSDIYGERSVRQAIFEQIRRDTKASLVCGIGDYNKTPTEEGMKEIRVDFDNYFGIGRWLSTAGNHEVERVDNVPDNLDWYSKHIGWGSVDSANLYVASKRANGDNFIMLETAFKKFDAARQAQLHSELRKAYEAGGRIFVFSHVPCIDSIPPEENEEDHGLPKAESDAFFAMMELYKVTAVFSSHQHGYETFTRGGVTYVGTAGGGSPLDEAQEQYHYVRVFCGNILRFERVPLFPDLPEKTAQSGLEISDSVNRNWLTQTDYDRLNALSFYIQNNSDRRTVDEIMERISGSAVLRAVYFHGKKKFNYKFLDGDIVVARMNGKIVGVLGYRYPENRAIAITHIAVDAACRGKGVGKALVDFMLKKHSGIKMYVFWNDNKAFWDGFGATPDPDHKDTWLLRGK